MQGSYPEELLASWDDYKEKQSPPSDEQIRPRERGFSLGEKGPLALSLHVS